MGHVPFAAFAENGHELFIGLTSTGRFAERYMFSRLRHGRESNAVRNFPNLSVSRSMKYTMLNIAVPVASITVIQSARTNRDVFWVRSGVSESERISRGRG
jgi:hypothetical protein